MVKIFLQLLGTETGDSTPSLLIHIESSTGTKRILINCGEGTQRFCVQHKIRLGKFTHILLTRLKWEQIGGLPGAILTMADAKVTKINLYGPLNTASFVESTRYFIARDALTFTVTEFHDNSPYYEDDIKVVPLVTSLVANPQYETEEMMNSSSGDDLRVSSQILNLANTTYTMKLCYPPLEEGAPIKDYYTRDPRPHFKNITPKYYKSPTNQQEPDDVVLSYAIHTPDIPGKFDAQKAKALGASPGPQFGKLSKGESITLPNGTIINPADVISPTLPGAIILVIHCPTEQHSDRLLSNTTLQPYIGNANIKMVIHLTPSDILNTPNYLKFMQCLGTPTSEHVVVNQHGPQPIIFSNWARNHALFNTFAPHIFPAPYFCPTPTTNLPVPSPTCKVQYGVPLQVFHLAPLNIIGYEKNTAIQPPPIDVCLAKPEIQKILKEAGRFEKPERGAQEFEILFLGTGAALPSKYRNVTGHLLRDAPSEILLDSGEGSYGQIYRRYGPEATEKILMNMNLVFISHIHADHHLGLVRVLSKRAQLQKKMPEIQFPPLVVISPASVKNWLDEYDMIESIPFTWVDCTFLIENTLKLDYPTPGRITCRTALVDHCPDAFGVAVCLGERKIVFSGDTRPCQALVDIGLGAELVIHEATFEDGMQEDAVGKKHATTSEAVTTAQQMDAKFVMLNHFSQRYPKMPVFQDEHLKVASIAFDLMEVSCPSDFTILPHLYEPIKLLCQELEKDEAPDAEEAPAAPALGAKETAKNPKKKARTSK